MDVVGRLPDELKIVGLSAFANVSLLQEQAAILKLSATQLAYGPDCQLERLVRETEADTVVVAVAGSVGVRATIAALETGKDVALATKEVLVAAGEIITQTARRYGRQILPIDSEHSAIFQCIHRVPSREVARICLTASGGPFRGFTIDQIQQVTLAQALHHPTWPNMGKKITVDSATMMNKGLELIEATWLFNLEAKDVDISVHPQSIVHSFVQFVDGSVLAQMGVADMRLPIQYALTYPNRVDSQLPRIDFQSMQFNLEFEPPDPATFPALTLARIAAETGGTLPAVLNAGNEQSVELFLHGAIRFAQISEFVEHCMSDHSVIVHPDIEQIMRADSWARQKVKTLATV